MRVRNFFHKYKSEFFWLFLNAFIGIIILAFCQPTYETDDDFTLGAISSGVFGEKYKPFLIYSNILYGYILRVFSWFLPSVNWYIVMEYIVIIVAYSFLFYLFGKKSFRLALIINLITWFLIIYDEIRLIQFTRTAFIVCIAGVVSIIYSCMNHSKRACCFGLVMCLIGSFIRLQCFFICIAYAAAFVAAYFLKGKFENKKETILLICKCAGVTIAVVICAVINSLFYTCDREWREYKEYSVSATQLLDYGMPSYEENVSRFESIGFSQNDISIYSMWITNDTDKFSNDNVKMIASWKEKKHFEIQVIKDAILYICSNYQTSIYFIIYIVTLICLVYFGNRGGKILAALNFFGTILIWVYLYYGGRMLPRIDFGIWMSVIISQIVGIFVFNTNEMTKSSNIKDKRFARAITIGIMLMLIVKAAAFTDQVAYQNSTGDCLKYFSEHQEAKYVLDTGSFGSVCFNYPPYLAADSSYLANYYYAGGWTGRTPFYYEHIKEWGMDNLIASLLNNEVYWVSTSGVDGMLLYLQENYNKNTSVNLVDSCNEFNIYKFSAG